MNATKVSHLVALIVVLILLIRTQEVFGQTQQGTQQGAQQQGLMQSQGLQGGAQQQSQKTAWYWHYRLANYRNTYYTRRGQEAGVKNGRLWVSASQRLSRSRSRVLNAFKFRPRVLHLRPQFSRAKGVAVSRSVQRMRIRLPRRAR